MKSCLDRLEAGNEYRSTVTEGVEHKMRRTCSPSFVSSDGQHYGLRCIDYSDKRIGEDFLQDALNKNPQVLPVGELDPSFTPLVTLGREIACIDNLFISPTGKMTVVETKLWRNPEATREVVGQILEYATKLGSRETCERVAFCS